MSAKKQGRPNGDRENQTVDNHRRAFWIGVAVTLISVVVGPYLGYYYGVRSQTEIIGVQRRQQAYSDLMGQRALLQQLYVSAVDARINFDYYNRRWIIDQSPKDSPYLTEASASAKRCDELAIELARAKQKHFETLGVIHTSYASDKKITDLVQRISHLHVPAITGDVANMRGTELEDWRVTAKVRLTQFVQREYAGPMNELEALLMARLPQ